MKLSTKFSLFNALSRVAILLLLVGVLPLVMSRLALLSTDQRLAQKKEKVLRLIRRNGITAFIEGGQSSYGSYNLLKEEFISLETIVPGPKIDVIEDSKRAVEDEIVQYRVLSYSFAQNGQHYLLEIGRSTGSIGETEGNFRRYAFYILLVAVVLTTLADLAFFRYLLAPFYTIIRQRLKNSHYPPAFDFEPVATGTDDFRYLDESLREMMATIQASFTKERKFIADASHELLTPLAALQYRFDNMLADEGLSEENQLRAVDVSEGMSPVPALIRGDLALPDKPSIAVLPFSNLSGDLEQEYFSDGITEDIITELSRFHSLFVIARNSAFTYKGRLVDVRTVARELGVSYVLEGSIRRANNRVRVTAQLIDAQTGNHIWAEK